MKYQSNDWQGAFVGFDEVLQLELHNPFILMTRGRFYLKLSHIQRALEASLHLEPNNNWALVRYDEAKQWLNRKASENKHTFNP